MTIEIVDLPIENGGSFQFATLARLPEDTGFHLVDPADSWILMKRDGYTAVLSRKNSMNVDVTGVFPFLIPLIFSSNEWISGSV